MQSKSIEYPLEINKLASTSYPSVFLSLSLSLSLSLLFLLNLSLLFRFLFYSIDPSGKDSRPRNISITINCLYGIHFKTQRNISRK